MVNKQLFSGFLAIIMMFALAGSAFAQDTTRPTVLSVFPNNNALSVSPDDSVSVTFSEDMDPSTINANTFQVMRRTTPAAGDYRSVNIEKAVTYSGRTATFNPTYDYTAGQMYGNVFTVTISGVTDLAGNEMARDFIWSFSTGGDAFNEDATTSSMFQGGAAIVPAAVPAVVVATTQFPWFWVILGGILLLLLIGLILAFARPAHEKAREKRVHHAKTMRKTPFGDVHPVIDLEGIGPVYNKELHKIGISNTKQLWEADASEVSEKTGAPLSSVKSWQNMAELSSVNDIGPQYAELLERSGVHSIDQLKHYNTDKLLRLVKNKQASMDTKIQGNTPGHDLVANWISEAKGHQKFSPA